MYCGCDWNCFNFLKSRGTAQQVEMAVTMDLSQISDRPGAEENESCSACHPPSGQATGFSMPGTGQRRQRPHPNPSASETKPILPPVGDWHDGTCHDNIYCYGIRIHPWRESQDYGYQTPTTHLAQQRPSRASNFPIGVPRRWKLPGCANKLACRMHQMIRQSSRTNHHPSGMGS